MASLNLLAGLGKRSVLRGMFIVLGVLLVSLAVLSLVKQRHVEAIASQLADEQQQVVDRVYKSIVDDFEAIYEDVFEQARDVARKSEVVDALARHISGNDPASESRLIEMFSGYGLDSRWSVELYTIAPELVAWNGFSMPLGSAVVSSDFPYRVQYTTVKDRDVLQALAVWHPVQYNNATIGSVRAMYLVGRKMPVENQYLESYTQADTWRRMTQLPVEVWLGAQRAMPERSPELGEVHALLDPNGKRQGYVYIPFPTVQELETSISDRYTDLQSLVILLILVCLVLIVVRGLSGSRGVDEWAVGTQSIWDQVMYFGAFTVVWWGLRFVLLMLDVPSRWQRGKAPLAPLFDPSHFASGYGWELLRSIGDMFITALFVLFFAFRLFRFVQQMTSRMGHNATLEEGGGGITRRLGTLLYMVVLISLVTGVIVCTTHWLGNIAFRAVLDSTLDYVERSGLMPARLVFLMFCNIMILSVGFIVANVALSWWAVQQGRRYWPHVGGLQWLWLLVASVAVLMGSVYLYGAADVYRAPAIVVMVFLLASWGGCIFISEYPDNLMEWVHFRGVLLGTLLLAVPVYVLLDKGLDVQQRARMMEAASSFDSREDPRVVFAIEEILNDAGEDQTLALMMSDPDIQPGEAAVEPKIEELLRLSPLSSLFTHDVSIAVFDTLDQRIAHFGQSDQSATPGFIDRAERDEFRTLELMYNESGSDSVLVEVLTGRYETDRFQYGGIGPLYHPDTLMVVGWIVARAEPRALLRDEGTLFPKLLLPRGVTQLQGNLSLAQFQGDVLVRTLGADFGQYRMPEGIYERLKLQEDFWDVEQKGDKEYITYYKRTNEESATVTSIPFTTVTAIRSSQMNLFDHLYYLLRLFVAGICIGVPIYALTRLQLIKDVPWRQSQFRYKDRVLNAFLAVGVFAVAVVGVFGLRVITAENDNAVQSWIKEHLDRVEEYLTLNAEFGELPSEVLERISVTEVAEKIGLDVNVYEEGRLSRTNREQLLQDRLIDTRLPVEAYNALNYEGARHAFTDEQVGDFQYRAGYRVLPDSEGRPRFVISVPTLPEQERIEEERARTVAYLFGALLLLIIVVMVTASLLANALARPINRLRQGLEAVARGRFERPLPVVTRDEIGQLVHTFNEMQDQLADSRRKLAQQERQLAWREMARQVAHEIKNPLTPMKLSVQHLRRAYAGKAPGDSGADADSRFKQLFDRITNTLIEQVDTLARIANEFSSFARMPTRMLEPLDLNTVLREAVNLMQEQVNNQIQLDLHQEPLVLQADRKELRRMYINLIKNAIEATSHQEATHIKVSSTVMPGSNGVDQWAYSTVQDQGTGIAPEMIDRIFEPNFSSKTSGTGLGLAIVKKSVEELHGEIGFETEEEVGTTFWIKLPLIEE